MPRLVNSCWLTSTTLWLALVPGPVQANPLKRFCLSSRGRLDCRRKRTASCINEDFEATAISYVVFPRALNGTGIWHIVG